MGDTLGKQLSEATPDLLTDFIADLSARDRGRIAISLKAAQLWEYSPKGVRNEDVQQLWDMASGSWSSIKGFDQAMIDMFRPAIPFMDQTPAEVLEQVTIEEVEIDGVKNKVYIPKALESIESRGGQVYFEGTGFMMKGMDGWHKSCARLAVLSNMVTVYPMDTLAGPENKAEIWRKCTESTLKWLHANAAQYKVDTSRICVYGSSSGGWAALDLLRRLAEKDEAQLVKFAVLDIPAIDNDFVANVKTPEKEENEMHRACSLLLMQTWAGIFTDLDKVADYEWDPSNPEIFPAQMSDDLLAKLPPIVLTTAEFDHVGLRGSQSFAKRLKAVGKLVGLYIQAGCGHGTHGTAQQERDEAISLIYQNLS